MKKRTDYYALFPSEGTTEVTRTWIDSVNAILDDLTIEVEKLKKQQTHGKNFGDGGGGF